MHRDVIVKDIIIRLCVHKNIGGLIFGDVVAHCQTAKLNVSPIFLHSYCVTLRGADQRCHTHFK